jgi:hypothetical protein
MRIRPSASQEKPQNTEPVHLLTHAARHLPPQRALKLIVGKCLALYTRLYSRTL